MSDTQVDLLARYEIQTAELQRERALSETRLLTAQAWRAEAIALRGQLGLNPTAPLAVESGQ